MRILLIQICFASFLLPSCSEDYSREEEPTYEALDGPYIPQEAEGDVLKRANGGDAEAYNNLYLWYLNEQRYQDAMSLAVTFAKHDSDLAVRHICELNRVYRLELGPEALSAMGGSSAVCHLES